MELCPVCNSENIYFSKKHKCYFCEDCEERFDSPVTKSNRKKVFISYGHDKNALLVNKIKEYLDKMGYNTWIDHCEIHHGNDWRERITAGILSSSEVLSFMSKHSMRDPGVCLDELKIALSTKHNEIKYILLESIEQVDPPKVFMNQQWLDLSNWESKINSEDGAIWFDEKMQVLINTLENEDNIRSGQELEELSRKLNYENDSAKYYATLREPFMGREWITEEVSSWFYNNPHSKILLIDGIAGCGKSIYAANLAYYMPEVAAHIFFDWNDSGNAVKFVRRIMFQLAEVLPDYRKLLTNRINTLPPKTEFDKLSAKELLQNYVIQILDTLIDGMRTDYLIIIDGIDEASENAKELLLNHLHEFPKHFRFILTSRPDVSLVNSLEITDIIRLDTDSVQHNNDIHRYFEERLQLSKDDPRIEIMLNKCEGMFLCARLLCDELVNGSIDYDGLDKIPFGFKSFIRKMFLKNFDTEEEYMIVRPILEILLIENEADGQLIRQALGLSDHEFFDRMYLLKELIHKRKRQSRDKTYYTYVLIHKSISEWLENEETSGQYWIDKKHGMQVIINMLNAKRNEIKQNTFYNFSLYGRLAFYLVQLQQWDNYKRELLSGSEDYDLWRYGDEFPVDYDISEIKEVLLKICKEPFKRLSCGLFPEYSLFTGLHILSFLVASQRYIDVFEETITKNCRYSGYFVSGCSDEMDTRDGQDKISTAINIVRCLKAARKNNCKISDQALFECSKIKINSCIYRGEYDLSSLSHSILNTYELDGKPIFYKDICILDYPDIVTENISEKMRNAQEEYNTYCMALYFMNYDRRDEEYEDDCIFNFANRKSALEIAIKNCNDRKRTEELIKLLEK